MSADAVDDLFGLPPSEFVAARNALARTLRGDERAAVAALRRPSPAAWALNQFARRSPDELARLAALGTQLAAAQAGPAADALRSLGAQRRQLVVSMAGQISALARSLGHPLGAPAAREVEATLEAVLADPDAAAAVQAGRLVRNLEHTGFGVDLDGAVARVAVEDRGAQEDEAARAAAERSRALEAAEQAAAEAGRARREAEEASAEAGRARREAEEATARARRAGEQAEEADDEVRTFERRLVEARRRHDQLAAAARDARAAAVAADHDAMTAQASAEAAARRLAELE